MESPSLQTKVRILLADPQPQVAALLQAVLEDQPDFAVVGVVGHGEAALTRARKLLPDVLVSNWQLPGLSGAEVLLSLTASDQPMKVVFLSEHVNQVMAHSAIRAGASGYVAKDAAMTELVPAIRAVMAGKSYVSSRPTRTIRTGNP